MAPPPKADHEEAESTEAELAIIEDQTEDLEEEEGAESRIMVNLEAIEVVSNLDEVSEVQFFMLRLRHGI